MNILDLMKCASLVSPTYLRVAASQQSPPLMQLAGCILRFEFASHPLFKLLPQCLPAFKWSVIQIILSVVYSLEHFLQDFIGADFGWDNPQCYLPLSTIYSSSFVEHLRMPRTSSSMCLINPHISPMWEPGSIFASKSIFKWFQRSALFGIAHQGWGIWSKDEGFQEDSHLGIQMSSEMKGW